MSLDLILEKAEKFEAAIENRHLIKGLILPTLVLPPEGREDLQTGNYENCAIWTGLYVAAQSLKYAATNDPQARAKAKRGLLALHKLQEITGKPGLIARGYKHSREQTADELFFWVKNSDKTRQEDEWHQAVDYRWLGDPSKSQVFGVAFGYFAFNNFCKPDAQEKEEIGKHLSAIVNGIIDSGLRIIDLDNKPTGHGNYSPKKYLGFGGIGPMLLLGKLKSVAAITGKPEHEKRYEEFLARGYSKFLERCRINPPILRQLSTSMGSEDNLAMPNYYMLMNLKMDNVISNSCRIGLQKRFSVINDPENILFNFLYHALMGYETPELQKGVNALARFPDEKTVPLVALKRKLPNSKLEIARDILNSARMPIQDRPVDEYAWRVNPLRRDAWASGKGGIMEFTGIDFLLAAYLGMYHGFVK